MAEDGCCRNRCSSISFGGLLFYSSLWPTMTASSCWTRLPKVGSSSRWSRGTSGGPSTAPNSLPVSRTEDWKRTRSEWGTGEAWERREGGLLDGHVVMKVEKQKAEAWSQRADRRCDGQAEWQTLINTSLWLHFMWLQTCFDCYCISPTDIAGDICSGNIMDEISTRAEKSPGISFTISLP